MFSYYGSKTKIIKKYPKPEKNLIIEPFAGSARYAIEYYYKDVILIDKYDKVCGVWEYLISATREEILKLPEVLPSQEISSVEGFNNLCQEAKWLLGFCCNRGSVSPKNYAGKFCSWDKDKIRIAGLVDKIKHWKVFNCDYRYVSNHDATWFVDPPYQKMGFLYKENKIDYKDLSMWCKGRNGQVIVCENYGADWMDFEHLVNITGQRKKSVEVIKILNNTFNPVLI